MTDKPYIVYVLHFDRPVGPARHYIGITRRERLAQRMHDHQGTSASWLTAKAAKLGIGFTLAKTFDAESHADEQRIKRAGHFDKICPICRGDLDLWGTRLHYAPRPASPPGGDWTGMAHAPTATNQSHRGTERADRPTRSAHPQTVIEE